MIIAIDGASTDLSLAVADPDGTLIGDDAWSSAQRQSAELLPHLLALLARIERPLHDATAVAVGSGPGSFTGLRVAMALAKGLAVGLRIPIVGVPSLEAWLDADPDATAAVARAGAREAYVLARGDDQPRIVDRDALDTRRRGRGGNGARHRVRPRRRAPAARRECDRATRGRAPRGRSGRRRPSTLEPIYLRAPRGVAAESGELVRWL